MTKKERAAAVCEILNTEYGTDLTCYLEYDKKKPWQLLFATILSAQCTDERVNMVTRVLFKKYPNLEEPREIDILTTLPGVGRKTANVVRGHIFNEDSIVVDTHVKRVSRLLGLTQEEDPVKIELDLMKVVPKSQWILYNHQIIAHGRTVCIARRPRCSECALRDVCKNKVF